MSAKRKTWTDTQLWKQLEKRAKKRSKDHEAAGEILPQMELWMGQIQKVLAQGHTDPLDFTLHDQEHSFRVAEWMYQLVRATQWQNLSDYEVALLLLAAYLHDIGMSPERKKVAAIYRHILTGEPNSLSADEAAELQRWLDNERDGLVPPLCKAAPTPADLDLAEEITTYYVRHKHNDWSKEWIEQNLSGGMHFLTDWRDVLIRLCQSHHAPHEELRSAAYHPRPVGPQHPQRLNLRHLACILRVADILENSPDRVPPIIFQHRNISERPKSIIHWGIPHRLSININKNHVHLSAWPDSAQAHKAIFTLADYIDLELAGCAAIAESQPFDLCPGLPTAKRDWFLTTSCSRLVQPKDNAYEYIDGAFRPNTAKLLQLLSGEQIYETPLAAVRELLQNAFDAVREKIARQRLKLENPADPRHEEDLGRHERVTLTLSQDADGTLRLSCQDTGCGMTKDIIQNHVLVSGDARRPTLIELERECEKAGFSLNRTGQFGIGVLSYFMMAREVRITTCRDQLCRDNDGPGWTFRTTGVGDFGELRKLPTLPNAGAGTLIEWRLDKGKFPDAKTLRTELEDYLRQTLIRIPCVLRVQTQLLGEDSTCSDIPIGWAHTHEQIKAFVSRDWSKRQTKKLERKFTESESLIAEWEESYKRMPAWLKEARESLRLSERIVPLPKGCGLMRVVLPWFDLEEGPSLAYVLRDRDMGGRTFTQRVILRARALRASAWKGMTSAVDLHQPSGASGDNFLPLIDATPGYVECDFTHVPGRQLQVNRASLSLESPLVVQCRALVQQTLAEMTNDLLSRGPQPAFYGLLADLILRRIARLQDGNAWFQIDQNELHFSRMSLPCTLNSSAPHSPFRHRWKGHILCELWGAVEPFESRLDLSEVARPERIAVAERWPLPVALWIKGQCLPSDDDSALFPPQWRDVWGAAIFHQHRIHNPVHWAVRLFKNARSVSMLKDSLRSSLNLDQAASIHDPAEAALTLMEASWHLGESQWKMLQSRKPELLAHLWELCEKALGQPKQELKLICFRDGYWRCLTHDSFQQANKPDMISSFLPKVTDPEWLVEVVHDEQVGGK